MLNPFEIIKQKKRDRLYEKDIREGIYNFEMNDGSVIRVDPLLTYIRLKELGFDVMGERIDGAMKGEETKTRLFLNAVCDAFGVGAFNQIRGAGLTVLDAFRLYLGFYRFLEALKKNITFLRDFAPSMAERLTYLTARQGAPFTQPPWMEPNWNTEDEKTDENEMENADSPSLDSTSISQTPPPSSDSEHTTEQAAPLADSDLNSTKPSTEETTSS